MPTQESNETSNVLSVL